MQGVNGAPLLVLSRAGKGRVALLASDHPWLWARGYDGGGPQLELLRRIAHWEMKEPDLEEEALQATVDPGGLAVDVVRRTMHDDAPPVTVTLPDGTTQDITLAPAGPGRFAARWTAPQAGLYRLKQGDLERVVALGPASPREFERTIASADVMQPAVQASRGGVAYLQDGLPALRRVGVGRLAAGPGWIGITPRDASAVTDLRVMPVLPAWAWLVLAGGLTLAAWLVEGRGRRRA